RCAISRPKGLKVWLQLSELIVNGPISARPPLSRLALARDDLPDGLIFRNRVKPSNKKYSASVSQKVMIIVTASRLDKRCETRRHDREAGCDGRDDPRFDEAQRVADGEGVWAWRPNGRCQACGLMIPQVTVTQKPVSPGRARHSPLKPSRRECRCFGGTCGDYLCAFYQCAQGCGCS